MTQYWFYPVSPSSGFSLLLASGEHVPVTAQALWDDIGKDHLAADAWQLSQGYKSMRAGDLVWIYESSPRREVVAVGRARNVYQGGNGWYVDLLWDPDATADLERHPIPLSELEAPVQSVRRASAVEFAVLKARLLGDTDPASGSSWEPTSEQDARERVQTDIVRRRGQQQFREALLAAYDRQCAVTGCTAVPALEAAHILPYRGEHTNRVANGLLLRADIHTLFDLDLIGVNPDGRLLVSSQLGATEYERLRGSRVHMPKREEDRPDGRLLAERLKSFVQ